VCFSRKRKGVASHVHGVDMEILNWQSDLDFLFLMHALHTEALGQGSNPTKIWGIRTSFFQEFSKYRIML
jgi:hypothetical protein